MAAALINVQAASSASAASCAERPAVAGVTTRAAHGVCVPITIAVFSARAALGIHRGPSVWDSTQMGNNNVSTGAELGKRPYDRLIRIRLHGVADERRHIGKRTREHLVVAGERGCRVAIKRGTDRCGERIEVHRLGVQHAVAISKVVHHTLS